MDNATLPNHVIVTACDERYATQLATTLRSIVETTIADVLPPIYVLSEGIAEQLREKVERSLMPHRPRLEWIDLDLSQFEALRTLDHVSRVTYARLLLCDTIPPHYSRVLYLDLDLIVRGSLAPLLEANLDGYAIGAVRDSTVEAAVERNDRWFVDVPRVERYFNAGVLVIDVARWKTTGVTEAALAYLADHPSSFLSDQDALNVACDGSWKELDPRWNFQEHVRVRPSQINADERPWIIHFVSQDKPWSPRTRSPYAALYDDVRSRTLFARGRTRRSIDWTVGAIAACLNAARHLKRVLRRRHHT